MSATFRQGRKCWLLTLALLAVVGVSSHAAAQGGLGLAGISTTPSQAYFNTIQELYNGEYRDARREFLYELRGSVQIGVNVRWIDAICYHAMLGETFYQMGMPEQALEQFNLACAMYLQYPNWMLQVQFNPLRPDTNTIRRPIPWGASQRQFVLGKVTRQMQILRGEVFGAQRVLQEGGVVRQAEF